MTIPELPGELVRSSPEEKWLKNHVTRSCELDNPEKVSFCQRTVVYLFVDFQAVSP